MNVWDTRSTETRDINEENYAKAKEATMTKNSV